MADKSYKASKTNIYFGGTAFLADLNSALDGTFVLTGTCTVNRANARDATGVRGKTADGGTLAMSGAGSFRLTDEVKKCLANPNGVLFIDRTDAGFAYAIPAVCHGIQIDDPSDGYVMYALTFSEGEPDTAVVGGSVAAVPTRDAGSRTVGSGQEAYVKDDSTIVRKTGNFSQTKGTVAVVGSALVAEGTG